MTEAGTCEPVNPWVADQDPFIWDPQVINYSSLVRFSLGRAIKSFSPTPVFPRLRRLELIDNLTPAFTLASFLDYVSRHSLLGEFDLR